MNNKFVLLSSLFTITSLFGCSNNNMFTATLIVNSGEELSLSHKVVDPNTNYSAIIFFDFAKYPTKKMPDLLVNVKINNNIITNYTYSVNSENHNEATLTIDKSLLKGDITITINGLTDAKWYEISNWWDYCSNGTIGTEATVEDIGKEVDLLVNNQIHKVRLIGVDHDDLADSNKKAHCTFEFVNLISDNNGNSLAIPYDWENYTNNDFPNSTLRNALDGGGKSERKHNKPWYQKEETEPSLDYSGKSVLDMLPKELQSKIKSVNKRVFIKNSNNYEITTYSTRIFPLSKDEIDDSNNNDSKEGEIYRYYKGKSQFDLIHRQINYVDEFTKKTSTYIPGTETAISNSAGYNKVDKSGITGGFTLLRTPTSSMSGGRNSYYLQSEDLTRPIITTNNHVAVDLRSVAPAFCL